MAEECTENIDEVKMAKITFAEHESKYENECKCSFALAYCVIFHNLYNQHWNRYLFYLRQIHQSS